MAVSNTPSEAKGGYVLMTTIHGYKYINTMILKKHYVNLRFGKKKKNETKHDSLD